VALVALALLAAACGAPTDESSRSGRPGPEPAPFDPGPAPATPARALDPATEEAVEDLFAGATTFGVDRVALQAVGASDDARLAWFVADLLRFFPGDIDGGLLVDAFESLTGTRPDEDRPWTDATDHLLAWDLDAPPGYVERKVQLLVAVDDRWAPLLADPDATLDWRQVSWGGVLIDDRAVTRESDGTEARCAQGCIPALVDPEVTDAAGGRWLDDGRLVFGLELDGEARAYPVHQLETHEMVHDELGGRRIALAFCTLCRAAQAYLVDDVDPSLRDRVGSTYDLRTSGLLRRSNKLTYERHTASLVDTFTGEALSGPMREAGVRLDAVTVVTSTWGAWRQAHPATTIIAEDGGIGRDYDLDPLGGRDDDGPIFPVGATDPRLPVQEQVLGAISPDGTPVAFPVVASSIAIRRGEPVGLAGLHVIGDADGFRVEADDGTPIVSHEAFWFAWSQFHPETELWRP